MYSVMICYYSRSGVTKKMAESIHKGIKNQKDFKAKIINVENDFNENLLEYDGLILGSPTYYGLPSGEIKKFIDETNRHHGDLEGLVGRVFTSSMNTAGGNETTLIGLIESLLIHGMILKGSSEGDHYGPVVIGSPDETDTKKCYEYGEEIAKLVKKVNK